MPTLPDLPDHEARLVPIGSLKPFGGNPRRGDVAAIRESLRVNGQYRPVVVRRETSEVLAGNHTLKAAGEEGWQELWATFVDVDVRLTIDFNASPPLEDQTAAGEARTELPADARLLYDHLSPGCEQRQYDRRTLGHLLGLPPPWSSSSSNRKTPGAATTRGRCTLRRSIQAEQGDRSIPC